MDFDALSDAKLVDEAGRGLARAFEVLYLRHREWVVMTAMRYLGDPEEALDVMQDVFSELFHRIPGFALTSTLRAYLYPAVKHHAISRIRKRSKVVPLNEAELEATLISMPRLPGELKGMIGALSPPLKEVVYMRFALDMRLDEIAAALSLPVGTVKSRLHNALKSLRKSED